MLVLTRKIDESIVIGDLIVLTVLAIDGEQVKLGINAPREVPILRQEVFQAVQDQVKIQQMLAEESGRISLNSSENFSLLKAKMIQKSRKTKKINQSELT